MHGKVMTSVVAVMTLVATDAPAQRQDSEVKTAAAQLSPLATTGPVPEPIVPPPPEAIDAALARGVRFLLDDQNADGSWGSATRTKGLNVYAPIPGAHHAFRAGTTALCIMALAEYAESGIDAHQDEVLAALVRAETWLVENLPELRRANNDALYNVWGHAYGIQALVRLHNRKETTDQERDRYRRMIAEQVDFLGRYETVNGGWGYYDLEAHTQKPSGSPTSFTTATALIAFDEARDLADIPQNMVERAVASASSFGAVMWNASSVEP